MKIFISWSGGTGKAAANAISQSITNIFNKVEPWVSSESIPPGSEWFGQLMSALEDSRFGIACITKRSLCAPWIMFESGALSAKFGSPKLVPIMLDGDVGDLKEPLSRFNGISFSEDRMRHLFASINSSIDGQLAPVALKAAFNEVWPTLRDAVHGAIEAERAATKPEHDVFLSVPMASFKDDSEYQPFRTEVLKVIDALHGCGKSVFCALENIKSMRDFDAHAISTKEDIEILDKSACFVLIYPQKLLSSALFEAGYAIAHGLKSIFFVKNIQDLPFLMQHLPDGFHNVSILDCTDWTSYDDIARHLIPLLNHTGHLKS